VPFLSCLLWLFLQKEGERLTQDAKAKKDKLMEAQSQLNDAQALASETKAEADRLRREVEEAEIKVASAASMQHHAPPTSAPAPTLPINNGNGFPSQPVAPDASPYGMGTAPFPSYGMEQKPGEPFGGHEAPHDTFNSNVMGSGGFSIPIPAATTTSPDDPYSNPFGE